MFVAIIIILYNHKSPMTLNYSIFVEIIVILYNHKSPMTDNYSIFVAIIMLFNSKSPLTVIELLFFGCGHHFLQ